VKKYTILLICLVLFFTAGSIFAQPVNRLPNQTPQVSTYPLPPPEPTEQFGFTGPSQTVPVVQARTLNNKTPVILRGNIVIALGHDLYTFRDSSGDITVRISQREWQILGANIGPSDTIEISGELHKDQRDTSKSPEVHARTIRKL
jgi:uncharacterized protein (TIGR00156 family)